jgi:hypothetical protein
MRAQLTTIHQAEGTPQDKGCKYLFLAALFAAIGAI